MTNQIENPLLIESTAPFGAPHLNLVTPEHFPEAFAAAMKKHKENIAEIATNAEPPSFENTIEPYEKSGDLLAHVSRVFFNQASSNTNPDIQALQREFGPKLTAHQSDILFDKDLLKRIQIVFDSKDQLSLDAEQARLLDEIYKEFKRSGATLSNEIRAELKSIKEELTSLTIGFGQNVLADTNDFELVLEDENELGGLPENVRAAAQQAANERDMEGKYLFTISRSSVTPFLQYSDNRDLREKIYKAWMSCGNNDNGQDNKKAISRLASLRVREANLLGYPSHAAYMLEDRMAGTPQAVDTLLQKLWQPALARANREAEALQSKIIEEGANFELAAWDWWYYAEKVRQAEYDLDESEIKPYFLLENVRDGAFHAASKLYGLSFERRNDIPLYHPDVQTFEVKDRGGSHIGLFYADYFMRPSKRGGAWMTTYRDQSNRYGATRPIVINVCNFAKGGEGEPVLLGFDEVRTLFHEFGHALHGLLANTQYESLSGTSVKRDFVELPSQIMEHWALEPEVMNVYARHFETNEPIPSPLVEKIKKTSTFNQGFATTEYLAASLLDLAWHNLETEEEQDVAQFEQAAMDKHGLIPQISPRYPSTQFQHIFSGGYSAGYYSYIWAEVLDTDGYESFKEAGIFNQERAQSFRQNVLERGNTEEPMELYRKFRGSDPAIEPLLKHRGLDG